MFLAGSSCGSHKVLFQSEKKCLIPTASYYSDFYTRSISFPCILQWCLSQGVLQHIIGRGRLVMLLQRNSGYHGFEDFCQIVYKFDMRSALAL